MTLWFCCKNPETPWWVTLLCMAVVAYALSPIDLIPDFIPVLGLLDDLILLPAAIWLIIRLIPPHVYADSQAKADEFERAHLQRPTSLVTALLIILLWVLLAVAVAKWLLR